MWIVLLFSMSCGAGLLVLIGPSNAGARPVGLPSLPLADVGVIESLEGLMSVELDHERWKAIVIHHSGTPYETLESLDRKHRSTGLVGIGHHFVIGRGDGLGDGEIQPSFRWLDQLPGAHAGGSAGAWYDQHAISICLVGNGDRHSFTDRQLQRTYHLVSTLMADLGLDPASVVLHSTIAPTTDPGWNFPEAWFHDQLASGG